MFSRYVIPLLMIWILTQSSLLSAQGSNPAVKGLIKMNAATTLYYSKGYEVRAGAVNDLLTEAIAFYKSEFPEISEGLDILVLDKDDWTLRYPEIGYGIPFFDTENSIVIHADKFYASSDLGYEDLSTDQEISEYDKYIISILAQSYITKNRGIKIPFIWMRDLLATYFAVCFFEVNDFLWNLNYNNESYLVVKSLYDYDMIHGNVNNHDNFQGPTFNFFWYQARFIEMSSKLFNKGGFKLLTELINHFQVNGSMEVAEEIIFKYCGDEYMEWKNKMK